MSVPHSSTPWHIAPIGSQTIIRDSHGNVLTDVHGSNEQSIATAAFIVKHANASRVLNPRQPLTVVCPICLADVGNPCTRSPQWNQAGWVGEMHVDRVRRSQDLKTETPSFPTFDSRELATVLHALRSMQVNLRNQDEDSCFQQCDHFDETNTPLNVEEIDALCERLSVA